jgi:hypothetical protein
MRHRFAVVVEAAGVITGQESVLGPPVVCDPARSTHLTAGTTSDAE